LMTSSAPAKAELVSRLGSNQRQVGLGLSHGVVLWRETGHGGAEENKVASRLGCAERAEPRAAAGDSARGTALVTDETRH
jgi:hypothetical protein